MLAPYSCNNGFAVAVAAAYYDLLKCNFRAWCVFHVFVFRLLFIVNNFERLKQPLYIVLGLSCNAPY